MTAESSTLGSCPHCGAVVASVDVLIEYETAEGEPAVWAECPDCGEVVDPS